MQRVDLCEECAKQKGVNDPAGFSLADLLLGLGASQEIEQAAGGTELKCLKSGRLGCADCYTTFAEGLASLLKSMHKGTKHLGKVPQALQQSRDQSEKLKGLRKKLDKAVAEEDFEQAARLRDEIKQASGKAGNVAAT
jgi:protein arginine kinase activator